MYEVASPTNCVRCRQPIVKPRVPQVPSLAGSEKDGAEPAAKPGTATKSPAKRPVESSEDDEVLLLLL